MKRTLTRIYHKFGLYLTSDIYESVQIAQSV
jgi:hypothetical protein